MLGHVPRRLVWYWGTRVDDVCYNPKHGPHLFFYCAKGPLEIDPKNPQRRPPSWNHYASAAYADCAWRSDFQVDTDSKVCQFPAVMYYWMGTACLHAKDFWDLPQHSGDPMLQHLPHVPGWDGSSSGVSAYEETPQPKRLRARSMFARSVAKVPSADLESAITRLQRNRTESVHSSTSSTSNDYSALSLPDAISNDSLIISIGNNTDLQQYGNSNIKLPWNFEGSYGPYRFEYCTKNDLEVYLITTQGRMLSNYPATQAWVECKSTWPGVHSDVASQSTCPGGGRAVFWTGVDCFHSLSYYNNPRFQDDPYITHKHQHGCGAGVAAMDWKH